MQIALTFIGAAILVVAVLLTCSALIGKHGTEYFPRENRPPLSERLSKHPNPVYKEMRNVKTRQ